MTVAVRLRPEAEQDLADAAAWYEEQLPGLANRFLDEALNTFSAIAEAPLKYPILHRDTRRTLIHRFPFGVFFRVESTAIMVLAVMHGSRNPRRWKARV